MSDALVPLFQAWQARPLDPCYVVVFLVPHQHCLVHQMRSSLALVAQKDRKAVAAALQVVYKAPTEAEARLAAAEAEWGVRYGAVFASWHYHWPSLVAFYGFPVGLRRVLYTTNPVEAVHRSFRRALKHGGALSNEMAALKLCYAVSARSLPDADGSHCPTS